MENFKVIPEVIYFATHIAIADNRLFDKEWYLLEELMAECRFDDQVRENVLGIVLDRPDKITLDRVIEELVYCPYEARVSAMALGLQIAYEDGNLGEKESVIFQTLRTRLHIDRKQYETLCQQAEKTVKDRNRNDVGDDILIKGKSLCERYENCLFSAEIYSDVVKEMSKIAKEDIKYASDKVEGIAESYRVYPTLLKKQIDDALKNERRLNNTDEKKQLEDFFQQLLGTINSSLGKSNENMEILRDRQAAASDSYTISFMGRTKAGKSTLHSVLLGGLNGDFIGKGSERTTRYNYVYDFEGMRIIDTPGIGAPGGKSDTEIASEVADESDLICYVVTSDSIQETEFNFLKKLKDKNKPVLIMLNKKDNIKRSEKKLQKFLDNPLEWYESDGEDSIQGHINRINTYVAMNHDFHNFSIVPVHLLAAKLALQETDIEKREKFFEGSRINVFLNTLRDMVSSSGLIQRSQTIYNSAVYYLYDDSKVTKEKMEALEALKNEIDKNGKRSLQVITDYRKKKREELENSYNSTFNSFLKEDVRKFADTHYSIDKKELDKEWKKFIEQKELERRIEMSYSRAWEQYTQKVEDILEEVEEDMNFNMEFGSLSNVKIQKVVDVKFALNMSSALLGILSLVITALNPIAGFIILGVSFVSAITAVFMKSKAKKIAKAQDDMYEDLVENVETARKKNLEEILKKFDNGADTIEKQISTYNEAIINALEKINRSLDDLLFRLDETKQDLNNAFGARIANYMTGKPIYNINDNKSMYPLNVERDFGKYILLRDSQLFSEQAQVSKETIGEILQEKLYVNEEVE